MFQNILNSPNVCLAGPIFTGILVVCKKMCETTGQQDSAKFASSMIFERQNGEDLSKFVQVSWSERQIFPAVGGEIGVAVRTSR